MSALKEGGAGALAIKAQNRLERLIEAPEYLAWSLDDWTSEQVTEEDFDALWGLPTPRAGTHASITWRNVPRRRRR